MILKKNKGTGKPVNKFKKKKKLRLSKAGVFIIILAVAFTGIVVCAVMDTVKKNSSASSLDEVAIEGEYSEEVKQAMEEYKPQVAEKGFQSRVKGYENNVTDIQPYLDAFDNLKSYRVTCLEYVNGQVQDYMNVFEMDRESGISIYTFVNIINGKCLPESQAVTDEKKGYTYIFDEAGGSRTKSEKRSTNADALDTEIRQLIQACEQAGHDSNKNTFNGMFNDFEYSSKLTALQDYSNVVLRMSCTGENIPVTISIYNIKDETETIYYLMDFDTKMPERPTWCDALDKEAGEN